MNSNRRSSPNRWTLRTWLDVDKLVLDASPALHASFSVLRNDALPVPMLCFPPESFFGQVVRVEALSELLHQQQVVVRCVSEFAMGMRAGLADRGRSQRGRLMPLETPGRSVAMDIVAFFAVRKGDKGEPLKRQFQALREQAALLPDAAARTELAACRHPGPSPKCRWPAQIGPTQHGFYSKSGVDA